MHANEEPLTIETEVGRIVTRGEEWGDQLVRHLSLPPGADFPPLLAGLHGDVCDCPRRRPPLLVGRPHRLDRRGRDLPRVQPGG